LSGCLRWEDVVELKLMLKLLVSFDCPDDRVHRLEPFCGVLYLVECLKDFDDEFKVKSKLVGCMGGPSVKVSFAIEGALKLEHWVASHVVGRVQKTVMDCLIMGMR